MYVFIIKRQTFKLIKKLLLSISLSALAFTANADNPVIMSHAKVEAQVEQTLQVDDCRPKCRCPLR